VVLDQTARSVKITVNFTLAGDGATGKPWKADWGDGRMNTYAAATKTVTQTYAKDGSYRIEVQDLNGDTRTHREVTVGKEPYKTYDPEKILPTMNERYQREAAKAGRMGYAKRYIG
jgi:PKD repeat protein